MGERLEDHLDLRRVDPTYHIHFDDGTQLSLTSDLVAMREQLESIQAGSFDGFLRYMEEGYRHYKLSLEHLVERDFRSLSEFCTPQNLLLLFRLKALVNHMDNMANYFEDPRLKIAFTFQNMYMGLNPFEAPAIYSLLQYIEFAEGIWFPMGGMYSIIEALTGIAEKWGVRFLYNAPVEKINVQDDKATGATLTDGRQFRADLVVANADLPYVYRCLLPGPNAQNQFERKKHGCSAIVFYWGLDKQYPQLKPHNLFLFGVDRQSFDPIFSARTIPEAPNFYIHAPVRVDPSLAPVGQDTLMVAIPVGHINETEAQDWQDIRNRVRKFVLHRLRQVDVHDLDDHIKFEINVTPRDWQQRYNLTKGSTHGLSHNLTQMGYLRPHNRHKSYHNLYFVGASTHPGTGLPTVLVSARLTAERILDEVGIPERPALQVTAAPT